MNVVVAWPHPDPLAKGRFVIPQSKHAIAVVDDDRRVRESVQSILESAEYAAITFPSAEAILESRVLQTVTCVITDVRLPGIDGIELQRRVRQERPRLPVIFITAHDEEGIRQQATQGGAVDFMVKPFDGAELLESIKRALNRD